MTVGVSLRVAAPPAHNAAFWQISALFVRLGRRRADALRLIRGQRVVAEGTIEFAPVYRPAGSARVEKAG